MTLYAVGKIQRSFGTRGFVNIDPMTHSAKRFEQLKEAYVGTDEQNAVRFAVDEVKRNRKGVFVKFHGVDDRTSSDLLTDQYMFVDEADLVHPPHGTYFVHDIVGCTVMLNGTPVGTVTEVYSRSQGFAQDIWLVHGIGDGTPKQYWLPAVPELLAEVDTEGRRIVIRGIEELIPYSD